MSTATLTPVSHCPTGLPVAKKKQDGPGRPSVGAKQVGIRFQDDLLRDLEYCCEGLGLDLSSLVRLICTEQLFTYIDRARQAKENRERSLALISEPKKDGPEKPKSGDWI